MSTEMTATEYELLTQRLMRLISKRSPLQTTRLEHDITLTGRSGPNQIDVIWEFLTPDGAPRRVIVECRKYRSPLKRQAVFAWRGVVDDLDSPDIPTLAVMVTVTGYQSGAQRVADTYGVVILHLREPTDQDVKRRLTEIRVLPTIRIPYIGPDVSMEATQVLAELPPGPIDACDCELLRADGSTVPLTDFLWSGELRGFDEPVIAPHRITRTFSPPVTLLLDGIARLQITSVSATVGEHELPTEEITVGDRRQLAWMVANVLDHTHVWFTNTDRHYVSDDEQPGRAHATDVVLGCSTQDDISATG